MDTFFDGVERDDGVDEHDDADNGNDGRLGDGPMLPTWASVSLSGLSVVEWMVATTATATASTSRATAATTTTTAEEDDTKQQQDGPDRNHTQQQDDDDDALVETAATAVVVAATATPISAETVNAAFEWRYGTSAAIAAATPQWEDVVEILLAHYGGGGTRDNDGRRIVLSEDSLDVVLDGRVRGFFHHPFATSDSTGATTFLTTLMDELFDRLVGPGNVGSNDSTGTCNASAFHRYLKFHVDTTLEDSASEGGRRGEGDGDGDSHIVDHLFGRELPELRDVPFSTEGSATNCVLYVLLERPILEGFLINDSTARCFKWNRYVRAMTTSPPGNHGGDAAAAAAAAAGSAIAPAWNIGQATVLPRLVRRRRRCDQNGGGGGAGPVSVVQCRDFPLYTAIRLGYTWYPVLSDLVRADPTVLESVDAYEVLPPFALAATVGRHERLLHPPVLAPSNGGSGGLLDGLLAQALRCEAVDDDDNDSGSKLCCCPTCGSHLFHLVTSETRPTTTEAATADQLADAVVADLLAGLGVHDDDDNNDGGNSQQRRDNNHEQVRWVDTIYNLLRASPAVLDKATQMGRAELIKLSLDERRHPSKRLS